MKTAIAILAAGAIAFAAPCINLALNPIQPAAAATPATFALIMGVDVAGETNEFIVDRGMTLGDCFEIARNAKRTSQQVGAVEVRQMFFCEKEKGL